MRAYVSASEGMRKGVGREGAGRGAGGIREPGVEGGRWSEALFCDAARALPDRNAALGSPVHIFYLTLTRARGAKLRGVINETKLLI